MLGKHGEDFIKILRHIKPSKHTYEVFSDWLVMAAAALYSWKKDEKTENEYGEIAKQYGKEELEKHSRLLAITVEALEEREQDFLGEIFAFAELANARNGQFFTPYNVSYMSAKMIIDEKSFPKNRICRINDPTCGSGGMLVAGAQVMKECGLDYQNDALFIGQDIDARCARMAYIQLSLLGVPAVIYGMNTLTFQEYWHRETIGYHTAGMDFRLRCEKMMEMVNDLEQTKVEQESLPEQPSARANIPLSKTPIQGELF